jgi:oligopeptide transport system substrate-binding protein
LSSQNGLPGLRTNVTKKRKTAGRSYTADKPLTFNLLYNTSDLHKTGAIAVASIWKKNLGLT